VVPAGSDRHSATFRRRYCAYIAPPIMATVLPISAFAASDDPVLITTPAPSLPTGMDFVEPRSHGFHAGFRDFCGDDRQVLGAGRLGGRSCRQRQQKTEIRRIDRRSLDAHHDFIRTRLGRRHIYQRDLEFAALFYQRTKLQARSWCRRSS